MVGGDTIERPSPTRTSACGGGRKKNIQKNIQAVETVTHAHARITTRLIIYNNFDFDDKEELYHHQKITLLRKIYYQSINHKLFAAVPHPMTSRVILRMSIGIIDTQSVHV